MVLSAHEDGAELDAFVGMLVRISFPPESIWRRTPGFPR